MFQCHMFQCTHAFHTRTHTRTHSRSDEERDAVRVLHGRGMESPQALRSDELCAQCTPAVHDFCTNERWDPTRHSIPPGTGSTDTARVSCLSRASLKVRFRKGDGSCQGGRGGPFTPHPSLTRVPTAGALAFLRATALERVWWAMHAGACSGGRCRAGERHDRQGARSECRRRGGRSGPIPCHSAPHPPASQSSLPPSFRSTNALILLILIGCVPSRAFLPLSRVAAIPIARDQTRRPPRRVRGRPPRDVT